MRTFAFVSRDSRWGAFRAEPADQDPSNKAGEVMQQTLLKRWQHLITSPNLGFSEFLTTGPTRPPNRPRVLPSYDIVSCRLWAVADPQPAHSLVSGIRSGLRLETMTILNAAQLGFSPMDARQSDPTAHRLRLSDELDVLLHVFGYQRMDLDAGLYQLVPVHRILTQAIERTS